MKIIKMRNMLVMAAFLLAAVHAVEAGKHSEVHVETRLQDKTPGVLMEYLKIKNALIADEFEKAQEAAVEMTGNYESYVKELKQPGAVIVTLNELVNARDLKAQRKAFRELSQLVLESIQKPDSKKDIFLQSCPMALGGQGAQWLSLEEQVRNPYMGQRMPACGSTIEKI